LSALWLAGLATGFAALGRFESQVGASASAPRSWPESAAIQRDPDRPTLLVFAHPRCPCTSATIEELNRLLTHAADRVRTLVVFYSDSTLGEDWVRSPSFESAARIPGVTVVPDELGVTARAFGARTSGQVCLYDRNGRLAFAGGITPARGHVGESAGGAALRALIEDGVGAPSAPVFGCDLLGPAEAGP
jgi:hypothetical protein